MKSRPCCICLVRWKIVVRFMFLCLVGLGQQRRGAGGGGAEND